MKINAYAYIFKLFCYNCKIIKYVGLYKEICRMNASNVEF